MKDHTRKDKQQRLGELLVQHDVITGEMLQNALRRQSQAGGLIGSVLMEMGYLTTETLLDFLHRQLGVPAASLTDATIPPDVLKMIPLEKIRELKILPIEVDRKIMIAMVNPKDYHALSDIEFMMGTRISPVVVPAAQMEAAIRDLSSGSQAGIEREELERRYVSVTTEGEGDIRTLLKRFVETRASDLQLTAGVAPSLRKSTQLERLNMPSLTPDMVNRYAESLMTPEQKTKFGQSNDLDFAFTDGEYGRFRVNIYRQRTSVSVTLRRIPDKIPGLRELGLPEDLSSFALKTQGLILVTGPAGHGKSTTMAALVDIINPTRKCNIITLEDPIEFLHRHKSSNVNQREIGIDTASFHEGLKHIFRQDPDVIVVGEMRDPESFAIALQAAETGHLVLSTLHARNATSTIERIIDMFPPHQQQQARGQIADCLVLVLSQRLAMRKDGSGPVLAHERLVNSFKIRNFIREGKTHQIRSQMQLPNEEYSSIDVSLARLCLDGLISPDEGARHADNPAFYHDLVRGKSSGPLKP